MRSWRDIGLFLAGFGVACILLLALGFWLWRDSQVARSEGDLRVRIRSLDNVLRLIDSYPSTEGVESVELDLIEVQRQLELLNREIPNTLEIPEFLRLCQNAARDLGLEISIQDINKAYRESWRAALIELSVAGTPDALQSWVDHIEVPGRLIEWMEAAVVSSEGRRVELRAILRIFSLISAGPPEVGELCTVSESIPATFYARELANLERRLFVLCDEIREDPVLVDVTLELAHAREQVTTAEEILSMLERYRKRPPSIESLMRALSPEGQAKQTTSRGESRVPPAGDAARRES